MRPADEKEMTVAAKDNCGNLDLYEEVNFKTFDQCFKNLNDNYNKKDKIPLIDGPKS